MWIPSALSFVLCLAGALPAAAPGEGEPVLVEVGYEAAVEAAAGIVEQTRLQHGVPGMAAAVWVGDRIVWARGFGSANLQQDVPAGRDTRFRLGSVSKLFAASLAAKLAAEGLVDLDADVGEYVEQVPNVDPPITLRLLLGHLGGIRHYAAKDFQSMQPGGPIDVRQYPDTRAALDLFLEDPLVASPGERFSYSTFGFTLVTAALEEATGEDFYALLQEHVLEPLAIDSLVRDDPSSIVPGRTMFYAQDNGALRHAPFLNPAYKWAGGGFVATAEDVARFGAGHFAPRSQEEPGFLFDEDTYADVFRSQKTTGGQETGTGIGWRVGKDPCGRQIHHHGGSQAGCRAVLVTWPEHRLSVALLSNLTGTPNGIHGVAERVGDEFLLRAPDADGNPVGEVLRRELAARMEVDQAVRTEAMEKGPVGGGTLDADLARRWKDIDTANTAWVERVIQRHGWPGYELVGKEGELATFLLVQHADLNPEFQERCLPVLKTAVEAGDAQPSHLAYLTDRVNVSKGDGRVSSFSKYEGYSTPRFDGWVRESFYVTMSDGVRLAVDLYRPTQDGALHEKALPLVWTHDRYHRASATGSQVRTKVDGMPGLRTLLRHGYLVADVDVRGAGASFGNWTGIFSPRETRDSYEVIEWFAAQDWCDGNIGMWGGSYLGGTQFMAASTAPPHLKAIFPFVALLDVYDTAWGGGIFKDDMCRYWGTLTRQLDRTPTVAPVHGPDGRDLLREAMREHEGNLHFEAHMKAMPFRDSPTTKGYPSYAQSSPMALIPEIQASGVAIYHQAGWLDTFPRNALFLYANLDNPQKMVIGPWFHVQSGGVDWDAEMLRWFDHWLKGMENGVMDEPPIHYNLMGAPREDAWRSADTWPLPNEQRVSYFLAGGTSGSIDSVNDGLLMVGEAPSDDDLDEYVVDPTTSVGRLNRWNAAVGQAGRNPAYQDQQDNDTRCLTWTTPPLEEDVVVTGHPVAHLWIESSEEDVDVFVWLEEVLPDGRSEYVTEGVLRASHRKLSEAPFERFGLPYQRSFAEDVAPLPKEPTELQFDLQPTANLFDAGHRIRITVSCADHETSLSPITDPATELYLYRTPEYPSRVVLPVIPSDN